MPSASDAFRSSSTTRIPRPATFRANCSPASPAPTTATSNVLMEVLCVVKIVLSRGDRGQMRPAARAGRFDVSEHSAKVQATVGLCAPHPPSAPSPRCGGGEAGESSLRSVKNALLALRNLGTPRLLPPPRGGRGG